MGVALEEVPTGRISFFCRGLTDFSSGRSTGLPAQVERSYSHKMRSIQRQLVMYSVNDLELILKVTETA